MEATKQSVGIDVSKDTLDVTFKEQTIKGVKIKGSTKFDNNANGHEKFLEWCNKREIPGNTVYILEATGVYHEEVLFFLYDNGKKVCVELPQRIKYYAKSKGVKTKNDKIDSGIIADYGIERNLRFWQEPGKSFRTIRTLAREHTTLTQSKTQAQNRLHAVKHSRDKNEKVMKRYYEQIDFFNGQLADIEDEIAKTINDDATLKTRFSNVTSIKGIGVMTAAKILSETDGFQLFDSIKQLVSYSGLDVIEKQSGNYSGKTKISKKGNSRLRTALYMPAMTAILHNKNLKEFNKRIMETHKFKKQGIVAVMRKLLILVYTLWKKNEPYNSNFAWGNQTSGNDEAKLSFSKIDFA